MKQYVARKSQKGVKSLYLEILDSKANISPKYQRNIVWPSAKKIFFIDSIFRNIVPNNIVFNVNNTTGDWTCIDGKQRLTSIIQFIENKYSIPIDGKNVYYSRTPTSPKDTFRCLSIMEKNIFNRQELFIVEYHDLEYIDQKEIFTRMQKGMPLKSGEIIPSFLSSEHYASMLIDFCDNNEQRCVKHIRNITKRRGHIVIFTKMLCMISTSSLACPDSNCYQKYLIETTSLEDDIATLQKYIDLFMTPELFNNDEINNMNGVQFSITFMLMKKLYESTKIIHIGKFFNIIKGLSLMKIKTNPTHSDSVKMQHRFGELCRRYYSV